ncbi:MAG: xylulokinase, partial [Methanocella sp.]
DGYLLGIDVGTSGTKTAVFAFDGALVAAATAEYPLSQPQPGWAEQDPEDWWQAVATGVRTALSLARERAGVEPGDVAGLGLSGQMHGAVLLDHQFQVIRPAIIWCDQRSTEQCHRIDDRLGRDKVIALTGNPALPNFTATKVLWVRDHEPENYARIGHVLLPKDYIRWRLTGELATEVSDASGTLFLDVAGRRWSAEMLAGLDIPREWLPSVHESPVITGLVSRAAAEATGLPQGLPVVGGGGDQAAGAVGNGIVEEGIVSSTIGTSGVVFAFTPEIKADPEGRLHSFCHAVPGKWHVMGVTQAAGGSLQWFRNHLGQAEVEVARLARRDPYELLAEEAATVPPGADGLVFLPYLMGERTPHLDSQAKGVFFGLTSRHTKAHLVRAVMEGVAFSLRDCLSLIEDLGIRVDAVRLSGGGARSPLWRQIQADVFGKEVSLVSSVEGPAFGVALLAGVGTGVYPSVEAACRATIRRVDEAQPDPAARPRYQQAYALYRRLYPALRDLFGEAERDSLGTSRLGGVC